MHLWRSSLASRKEGADTLRDAAKALRATAGQERLSAEARAEVLRRVVGGQPVGRAWSPVFPPFRRFALAGSLPIVLAATLLWMGLPGPDPVPAGRAEVRKDSGLVVFEVSEGARVTKSTVPFAFDRSRSVVVEDGTFTDAMGGGPRLVFDRIE